MKPTVTLIEAAVVYEGPSLLTGDPIVVILTGMTGESLNEKTGAMVHAWIIRADMTPSEAVAGGGDEAICGDCKLRGDGRFGRACYVTWWQAPGNVYRVYKRGGYPVLTPAQGAIGIVGEVLRIGAYGDPVAVPLTVWRHLIAGARGWTGYTHQWKVCDPQYARFCMASVDSEAERLEAKAMGWRTYRTRRKDQPLMPGEIICPASDEFDHRVTCEQCQLCRGRNRPAKDIAIIAHGARSESFTQPHLGAGQKVRWISTYERKTLAREARERARVARQLPLPDGADQLPLPEAGDSDQ